MENEEEDEINEERKKKDDVNVDGGKGNCSYKTRRKRIYIDHGFGILLCYLIVAVVVV